MNLTKLQQFTFERVSSGLSGDALREALKALIEDIQDAGGKSIPTSFDRQQRMFETFKESLRKHTPAVPDVEVEPSFKRFASVDLLEDVQKARDFYYALFNLVEIEGPKRIDFVLHGDALAAKIGKLRNQVVILNAENNSLREERDELLAKIKALEEQLQFKNATKVAEVGEAFAAKSAPTLKSSEIVGKAHAQWSTTTGRSFVQLEIVKMRGEGVKAGASYSLIEVTE